MTHMTRKFCSIPRLASLAPALAAVMTLLLLGALPWTSQAQNTDPFAAMVMEVGKGKAVYDDGVLKGKAVQAMEFLNPGDLIKVPEGETVAMLFFETNNREEVKGPARVKILGSGSVVEDGPKTAVTRQSADYLPDKARLEAAHTQNFGISGMRNVDNPEERSVSLLSPVEGAVRPAKPLILAWKDVNGSDSYRVTLKDAGTKPLKTWTTKKNLLEAEGATLLPATKYLWTVEAFKGKELLAQGNAAFTVMSEKDAATVADGEQRILSRFKAETMEQDISLVLLFRTYNLQVEEAQVLKRVLARDPRNVMVSRRLASLNPALLAK